MEGHWTFVVNWTFDPIFVYIENFMISSFNVVQNEFNLVLFSGDHFIQSVL